MFRGYNLKQKEVVNIKTAERLGRISDVEISESTGEHRSYNSSAKRVLFGKAFRRG